MNKLSGGLALPCLTLLAASLLLPAAAQADPSPECNAGPDQFSTECGANSVTGGAFATAVGDGANAAGAGSTAVGRNAAASETNATAIGNGSTASGQAAIAVGANAEAEGRDTVAVGPSARAGGDKATALGGSATATAAGSVAIGHQAVSEGVNGTAVGLESNARGLNAAAFGFSSLAAGENSLALGTDSAANGLNSMAVGRLSTASAANASAIGPGATANFSGSTAVGFGAATSRNNQIMLGGQGSSVTIGDIASSTAAQVGPVSILTIDENGTVGRASLDLFSNLGGQVDELFDLAAFDRRESRRGVVAAIAMSEAPFPSAPGRTSYAANTAYYRGEVAVSASLAHRLNVGSPLAVTVGVAHSGGKNTAVRAGVAGEF